jgi:hypothetical protein
MQLEDKFERTVMQKTRDWFSTRIAGLVLLGAVSALGYSCEEAAEKQKTCVSSEECTQERICLEGICQYPETDIYTPKNDQDQDGFNSLEFGGEDCDDNNPEINPDAIDFCDNLDNNCNNLIDELGCGEIFYSYQYDQSYSSPENPIPYSIDSLNLTINNHKYITLASTYLFDVKGNLLLYQKDVDFCDCSGETLDEICEKKCDSKGSSTTLKEKTVVLLNLSTKEEITIYSTTNDSMSDLSLYCSLFPNGKNIVCSDLKNNQDERESLLIINTETKEISILANQENCDYLQPQVSPDGTMIAFTKFHSTLKTNWDIHVINSDGTGEQQLTFGNIPNQYPSLGFPCKEKYHYSEPQWTKDNQIITRVDCTGWYKGPLLTIDPSNSNSQLLFNNGLRAWKGYIPISEDLVLFSGFSHNSSTKEKIEEGDYLTFLNQFSSPIKITIPEILEDREYAIKIP